MRLASGRAPAPPVIVVPSTLTVAAAVIGALVEQRVQAEAQACRRAALLCGEGGGMGRKAHDRRRSRGIAADNVAEFPQRRTDARLALALNQAKEAEHAVVLCGAPRNLLELQHRRAHGGGVDVGHDADRLLEGGLLRVGSFAARRVLREQGRPKEGRARRWRGGGLTAAAHLVQRSEIPKERLDVAVLSDSLLDAG